MGQGMHTNTWRSVLVLSMYASVLRKGLLGLTWQTANKD